MHATAIAVALSALAVAALAAWQAAERLRTSHPAGPLFVSACLTVIAGLWLARGQDLRLKTCHRGWDRHRLRVGLPTHNGGVQFPRADTTLSRQIAAARRELESDLPNERRTEVRDQLDQLVASYRDVETMPTWPVDRTVRRRLTLGNVVLIVPLVSRLAALVRR